MKRHLRLYKGTISNLFVEKEPKIFTKQTIKGLFRVLLETVMEQKDPSVVLFKTLNTKDYAGVLSRIEHTDAKIYSYGDSFPFLSFKNIEIQNKNLDSDEFLIILTDRLSICVFWKETKDNIIECHFSMNAEEITAIINYLQNLNYSEELEKNLKDIRQDRRQNNIINSILSKLIELNDEIEKELLCLDVQTEGQKQPGIEFSTIAHELRNPISIIDLNTTLATKSLEKAEIDDDTKKRIFTFLDSINKAIGLLNSITNSLADFAKEYELNLSTENLIQVVEEAKKLMEPQIDDRKAKFTISQRGEIPEIKLDKEKFTRVLINLIKNATEVIKSKGTISVEILKIKDYILLTIKDNGSGIREENQKNLFKPFFTTKKSGTGIGLYESKKIVLAHNGDLKLISSDEKGTTFGIFLPIN